MIRKLIDITKDTKVALQLEAVRLGFDGLKPYIEALLDAKAISLIKASKEKIQLK